MNRKSVSMSRWLLSAACMGGAGIAVTAPLSDAQAHEGGDLMFYVVDDQLTVGRYDFDGGTGEVLEAVTEEIIVAEMEPSWEGGPNPGTDEPGLATDGSIPTDTVIEFPFPANTALTAESALLPVLGTNAAYWDGTGPVDFGALPSGQFLIVESPFVGPGLVEEIELDGSATAPTGTLAPWQSDAAGTAHDHFEFLHSAADADAAAGIYLFALDYATTDSSVAGTTLYYLLGYGGTSFDDPTLEGLLETAEGFVETSIVPEPATASLLALGGLTALRRRRHA
ncbi:MAG: PEP-CTERM sorting domain-containing protein [Planctomycetota bacterium]